MGGGDAPASLLFTLLSRGQLHTPVPLFQRTRQKGLSPRCHDFYVAHQEQVELMDEFRKVSLGGKTDPTAAVAGLAAELGVLKCGKALLERLTGFHGEQKEAPLRRARSSPPKTGAAAAMMETDEEQVPPPAAAAAVAAAAADEEPAAAADGVARRSPWMRRWTRRRSPCRLKGNARCAAAWFYFPSNLAGEKQSAQAPSAGHGHTPERPRQARQKRVHCLNLWQPDK